MICFFALVYILRMIARDEIAQIFQLQRIFLEGKVNVRPEIVNPDFFCPGCFCRRMIVTGERTGVIG